MTEFLNAIVLLANFVIVPAIAYGAQLALGALGVTMIFGILRFANFAHGELMAFGAMVTILCTWMLQARGINITPLPTALLALPVGIAVAAALALATDRMVYRSRLGVLCHRYARKQNRYEEPLPADHGLP